MPLKITIGCCNHLFGEGLKKLLLEECNLDGHSNITVSTNPREIIKEENDLLITDFNTLAGIIFDDISDNHKVRILLLGTGCLPKIENECLVSFISQESSVEPSYDIWQERQRRYSVKINPDLFHLQPHPAQIAKGM